MENREKLRELMKDPHSVDLAFQIAEATDPEFYSVAMQVFRGFSADFSNKFPKNTKPEYVEKLKNRNIQRFSEVMRGEEAFGYWIEKHGDPERWSLVRRFSHSQGLRILGVELYVEEHFSNHFLIRLKTPWYT